MTSLPLVMVRGSVLVAPDQALPRLIVSATLSKCKVGEAIADLAHVGRPDYAHQYLRLRLRSRCSCQGFKPLSVAT